MMKRSWIDPSVAKSIAAAAMAALAVVVVAGSLMAPAGAQTQQPGAGSSSKIAAIKACAAKKGITLNSLAALMQLSPAQRRALQQCVADSGVVDGSKIAAIKACAAKSGITLNSLAALKQLSAAQRSALEQCLHAGPSGGTI